MIDAYVSIQLKVTEQLVWMVFMLHINWQPCCEWWTNQIIAAEKEGFELRQRTYNGILASCRRQEGEVTCLLNRIFAMKATILSLWPFQIDFVEYD